MNFLRDKAKAFGLCINLYYKYTLFQYMIYDLCNVCYYIHLTYQFPYIVVLILIVMYLACISLWWIVCILFLEYCVCSGLYCMNVACCLFHIIEVIFIAFYP
jgi:hypothetical protein